MFHVVKMHSSHVVQYTRRHKGCEWESGGIAGPYMMRICRQRSSQASDYFKAGRTALVRKDEKRSPRKTSGTILLPETTGAVIQNAWR
jgi:hypothetical protein